MPYIGGPPSSYWYSYCRTYGERKLAFVCIIALCVFVLVHPQGLIVLIVGIKVINFLFLGGNRTLIGLFNKSVAGLDSPVPIGVGLISNKITLILSLLPR